MVLQGGFLVGIADLLLGGFGVDVEGGVVVYWRCWKDCQCLSLSVVLVLGCCLTRHGGLIALGSASVDLSRALECVGRGSITSRLKLALMLSKVVSVDS